MGCRAMWRGGFCWGTTDRGSVGSGGKGQEDQMDRQLVLAGIDFVHQILSQPQII
jgi:hypothetical protein